MSNEFCHVCYKKFLADITRRARGNKNVFVDVKNIVFYCRIPRFTHDAYGKDIAIIRDCEKNIDIVLPLAEFRRKRAAGEL